MFMGFRKAAVHTEILKADRPCLAEKDENPCWDGYEMVGMKDQDGKQVPNCVPKK